MALNDVPQSSQSLADTQNPIRQNFSTIDTAFEVDHVAYGAAGQGQHAQVTMPVQAPAPTFAAGLLGIYSFLNATTTKNEMYIHKQTGATTVDIPFTASTLSATAAPVQGSGGFTYLPSGMKIQFGFATGQSGGLISVNLSVVGIPAFNDLLSVLVCPYNTTTSDVDMAVRLVDITGANAFRVYISARTSTGASAGTIGGFQFLAIGY